MKIVNVVGARPNFVKIAPIMAEMQKVKGIEPILLHTGQHYDYGMSERFFNELGIPVPDIHLEVGSDTHGRQVAKIMNRFDDYCAHHAVDLVLVVGDVNSTMACSLVASKRNIKVAHIEAGIRSRDRSMPEEINRIVTDSVTDYFFPPSEDAVQNLVHEGHRPDSIHLVGNIMIDTLINQQEKIDASRVLDALDVQPQDYALLTLHRPGNVDQPDHLSGILDAMAEIQEEIKLVFPVHPRTLRQLENHSRYPSLKSLNNLIMTGPFGYHDFGKLLKNAQFVLTDSGGIQEETTYYRIPCITLRENTERPVTITLGTNELAGSSKERIMSHVQKIQSGDWKRGSIPPLWDGLTAHRILQVIKGLNL